MWLSAFENIVYGALRFQSTFGVASYMLLLSPQISTTIASLAVIGDKTSITSKVEGALASPGAASALISVGNVLSNLLWDVAVFMVTE